MLRSHHRGSVSDGSRESRMACTPNTVRKKFRFGCRAMKDDQIGAARESARTPLPCQTNPPHCVLVVDGDLSTRRSIAQALAQFDYGAVAVADGAAAWEALNTDSY